MQRFNISKSNLKKLTKRLSILYLFVFSCTAFSQQIPHYTQYLYNMQIINPAYVGVRSDLSLSALSREQWSGISGAPTTRTFSVNGRTRLGLGLGATFTNDKIGLSEINNINIDGSYTIITSENSRLSFGLKLGSTFFSNNLANGITPDNDSYASNSGNFYNVGFGAFFYSDNFFVGLSVPYLLESPQFFIQPDDREIRVAENQDYFLSAGYLFELSEDLLFKPSTMIRYTTELPISIDLNSNFMYKELLEAGISYRYNNSISAMFAIIFNKKFRIGYAYDYTTNDVIGNFNTHEFILHLDLDLKRNTRWLRSVNCYF